MTSNIATAYMRAVRAKPVEWIANALGVRLWSKQREILQALGPQSRRFVTVPACNACGKSFLIIPLALWFLNCHFPAKVIITSASWANLRRQVWPYARALRSSPSACSEIVRTGDFTERGEWTWAEGHGIYLLSSERPEIASGYHAAGGVLWIVDEASGLDPRMEAAIYGCLASGNGSLLLIGNPLEPDGVFYRACAEAIANANEGRWHRIQIRAFDCPAFTGAEPNMRGLATPEWVDTMRATFGEENPYYIARVLAEFPDQSTSNLFRLTQLREAVARDVPDDPPLWLGVDVARYGDDLTVFVLANAQRAWPPIVFAKQGLMEVVGNVIQLIRKWNLAPYNVKIDDTGLGGGVTDRLREQGYRVTPVVFGAAANDATVFANRAAEMAFAVKEWLDAGAKLPADDKLLAEMAALRYAPAMSDGRLRLESKDELRRRLGRSPDRYDALALAIYKPAPQRGAVRYRTIDVGAMFGPLAGVGV